MTSYDNISYLYPGQSHFLLTQSLHTTHGAPLQHAYNNSWPNPAWEADMPTVYLCNGHPSSQSLELSLQEVNRNTVESCLK